MYHNPDIFRSCKITWFLQVFFLIFHGETCLLSRSTDLVLKVKVFRLSDYHGDFPLFLAAFKMSLECYLVVCTLHSVGLLTIVKRPCILSFALQKAIGTISFR